MFGCLAQIKVLKKRKKALANREKKQTYMWKRIINMTFAKRAKRFKQINSDDKCRRRKSDDDVHLIWTKMFGSRASMMSIWHTTNTGWDQQFSGNDSINNGQKFVNVSAVAGLTQARALSLAIRLHWNDFESRLTLRKCNSGHFGVFFSFFSLKKNLCKSLYSRMVRHSKSLRLI